MKRFLKEKYKKALVISLIVTLLIIVGVGLSEFLALQRKITLTTNIEKYMYADTEPTLLPSRKWMAYTMQFVKRQNFSPTQAARVYAYVASIYYDVLKKTKSTSEAELATGNFLLNQFKIDRAEVELLLNGKLELSNLETKQIYDYYVQRLNSDNYNLRLKMPTLSKGKWFVRNKVFDKGAAAGSWRTWIIKESDEFSVPPPPPHGSLQDIIDLAKIKYAVDKRSDEDYPVIYFWHGSSGFTKGQNKDNITPAGVWQNILFVEEGDHLNNLEYAYAQKILAQSIADSFIKCWKVKFSYWTQRPSMRTNLKVAVQDPPFPSYVSGHSTISATAATVLSSLFIEKKKLWWNHAWDARNSRLIAGIHFDSDNEEGFLLGSKIGERIKSLIQK